MEKLPKVNFPSESILRTSSDSLLLMLTGQIKATFRYLTLLEYFAPAKDTSYQPQLKKNTLGRHLICKCKVEKNQDRII